MSWAGISSDYTAYSHPRASRFVEFRGGLYQNLTSKKLAGESSHLRISVSLSLQLELVPGGLSRSISNRPQITLQCLGAAATISAPSVPAWNASYTDGNICGLINAMLSPAGKFANILMVFLSLSVTATNAPTTYSTCIDLQALIPPLVVVPRYMLSVFVTAL